MHLLSSPVVHACALPLEHVFSAFLFSPYLTFKASTYVRPGAQFLSSQDGATSDFLAADEDPVADDAAPANANTFTVRRSASYALNRVAAKAALAG